MVVESAFVALTLRRMEWELCEPCADAVGVMMQTAEIFGAATAQVLSVLCGPCAEAGLAAVGNGPGA